MWFEILPSFGIIVIAMAAPHGVAYALNKLCVDNFFRRNTESRELRRQYIRDWMLTGSPYVLAGLEAIPDE